MLKKGEGNYTIMGGNAQSTSTYRDLVDEASLLQNQVSFITFNENTFSGIPWPRYIEQGHRIQETMIECRSLIGILPANIGDCLVGNTISDGITTERLVQLLPKLEQLREEIEFLEGAGGYSLNDHNTLVQSSAVKKSLALIESTRTICENLLWRIHNDNNAGKTD
jgi:hypothetical protein